MLITSISTTDNIVISDDTFVTLEDVKGDQVSCKLFFKIPTGGYYTNARVVIERLYTPVELATRSQLAGIDTASSLATDKKNVSSKSVSAIDKLLGFKKDSQKAKTSSFSSSRASDNSEVIFRKDFSLQSVNDIFDKNDFVVTSLSKQIVSNSILQSLQFDGAKQNTLPPLFTQAASLTAAKKLNVIPLDPTNIVKLTNDQVYNKLPGRANSATENVDELTNYTTRDDLRSNSVLSPILPTKLKYRMMLYLLDEIKKPDFESSYERYVKSKSRVTLGQNDVELPVDFLLRNKSSDLRITLTLSGPGTAVISQTQGTAVKVVNLFSAIELFYEPSYPPSVEIQTQPGKYTVKVHSQPLNDASKISFYRVYQKNIDSFGSASSFLQVYDGLKEGVLVSLPRSTSLAVVRVVIVDSSGKESHLFSERIVGEGYPSIINLAIAPYPLEKGTRIDVYGSPRQGTLEFYSRLCTTGGSRLEPFELIGTVDLTSQTRNYDDVVSFVDNITYGAITEYVVKYTSGIVTENIDELKRGTTQLSNYAIVRSPYYNDSFGVISQIDRSTAASSIQSDGSRDFSFAINTTFTKDAKVDTAKAIKDQLGDFYTAFFEGSQTSLFEQSGTPDFGRLIAHEIVRTNLRTREREVFPLLYEGNFLDNSQTRDGKIKPINLSDTYLYQVYTYIKDPISLLSKYIVRGKDSAGQEYFFLPYKWRHPRVISDSKMFAEDDNGYPIIDDDFDTWRLASCDRPYLLEGAADIAELVSVNANRVDSKTVRISWSYSAPSTSGETSLVYESFIVMKVVNGVRQILGKTKSAYFRHSLTEEDVGNVYYIVIPVVSDLSLDNPGFSNVIFVDTDVIIPKIPAGPKQAR